MSEQQVFFLIAGEASGDLLGARLMQALKKTTNARFVGIGGPRMEAEGIELLFPQKELAHFGIVELIAHLPRLLKRIKETIEAVVKLKPDALITIDSPDFCFRVAKKVRAREPSIPLIHYVAPTVWAWRPSRAKKIAKFLDHLMALLPFEPPYFTREHLPCTFVGHPLVESGAGLGDASRFRAQYGLPRDARLLAVLPGSRMSEINSLLPLFSGAVVWLRAAWPQLTVVVPTIPAVAASVRKAVAHWPVPVIVTEGDEAKYDAFAAADVALACSGTVSVELAMAGVPSVIAYRVNPLTYQLFKRFVRVKFATLVNIMANRMVMPEVLQNECVPEKIADQIDRLLASEKARDEQRRELATLSQWLGEGQFVPSERAAQVVLDVVRGKRAPCR